MKNLVIVESPAKAKTIEKYLGKDFTVKSSFGHVRDLKKGNDAIDIANGFKPTYVISDDKKQIVSDLKKLAKEAEIVWLATDDDREGEAISWHLMEALDLKKEKTKRIVFREITQKAILNAIANPRGLNYDLINAQQARRVLDRLVGFEISPILWKKVKAGLSAGRVQSVAVRLVVEREREIEHFSPTSAFKVTANFNLEGGKKLFSELPKKFSKKDEAKNFLNICTDAIFKIGDLQKKPAKRSPTAPFTTSTLQQEASRKLSFSVLQTMTLAQKLYEAGHITYMRTDSENLSDEAIAAAAKEIKSMYGDEYSQPRQYKTKSKSAQEAHEAIRPTDFKVYHLNTGDSKEEKLYELIWKRAVASQMADAQLERTIAKIDISTTPEKLEATGEVIKFDGFLKLYIESTDEEGDEEGKSSGVLPPLKVGQILDLDVMKATERFTRPAPRYTEASLVKKLEELGIGRPSTYAPTIATIQKREYVVKESREGKLRDYTEITLHKKQITEKKLTENTGAEKNKLFPTDIGKIVNDFLINHFQRIIDYSFTANVEEQFDEIANSKVDWRDMIEKFYGDFHKTVVNTEHNVERASINTARKLGTDPKSGKEVIAKLGRYGAYVQIGSNDDNEKPLFASLRKGQSIETISLEEALELFKLPREVGEFEGKKIKAAIGRFGPYLQHGDLFVSLGKDHDPLTVDEPTAIQLILAKREADSNKIIKEFKENPDVKVLNGRYGAYITFKKQNIKIPKGLEPKELTLEKCLELIEASTDKKGTNISKSSSKKDEENTENIAKEETSPTKKASSKTTAQKKASAKSAKSVEKSTKKSPQETSTTTKTTKKKSVTKAQETED
ncbi:MAG: type I DNA topoisomerase [Flammeovirgaceae bacterium]